MGSTTNTILEEFFENELAKRFEEMVENSDEVYFDTEEISDIIIYYLEIGDVSYAEMAVNHGLKLHPNSVEIQIKQLEVLLEQEKYPEAKTIINQLREMSMEDTDFLVCCAKYYSNLGNPLRAIDYCKKALELGEEVNFLHNFIADELLNLDDPFNALKHYQLALNDDPTDEYSLENVMGCYALMNKNQEAVDFINSYLDKFPFSETAWAEYGQLFFNMKKYNEALKGYDYLLAINPDSANVYATKAACYEAMKKWPDALACYEEMLQVEYTQAYTHYRIGLCYREMKQPVHAMTAFQKSLREDPQFYLSMMEQSHIYEELGSMPEALHFAKEAQQLNPTNLDYLKRLAYLHVDAGNFEESAECLKKMVETEPSKFYNWYAYIEVLMLLGEHEQALTTLLKAVKKHKRAELYYQLSNCYFILNDRNNAAAALQKAHEIDPSIADEMEMKYPHLKIKSKTKRAKKN